MQFLHILALGCCLFWHGASAYYTLEQLEQIEQKYESPIESEEQYYPNAQQSIETLKQAFSQLEPSQIKNYGHGSSSGFPSSLLSGSNYGNSASASHNSPADSGLKSLEGKSSEYSKVTHIPSGSLFSMPDKGAGSPLEFESPFSKQPYSIVFRTHSMPVKIKQQHQTLPAPEVEYVRSQEDAHRIRHEVVRPIIQEVHEIIQPYRRVVQEVRPVQEEIHTIVSKGESRGSKEGASDQSSGGRASSSSGGGRGNGGNGGLKVGYSENQPRYASPTAHYRLQQTNQAPVAPVRAQHPIPQYSGISRRGPFLPLRQSRYY